MRKFQFFTDKGGQEKGKKSPPAENRFSFGDIDDEFLNTGDVVNRVATNDEEQVDALPDLDPADELRHGGLSKRSVSATSVESAVSVTSEELNEPTVYTNAPFEVFGESEEIGRVRVAKEGENLPLEKWKQKRGFAVKFSVNAFLEVSVIDKRDFNKNTSESFSSPGSTSTPKKKSSSFEIEEKFPTGPVIDITDDSKSSRQVIAAAQESNKEKDLGEKFASKQEWLSNLNQHFVEIVVGGLEVSLRQKVAEKIEQKTKLNPKENMSLIHSINFHIFQFIGKQRPDNSLCRDVAELFKKYLPETFAFSDSIMTDFGPVPVKKHKGEGGLESLGARIANNFYNRYVRVDITRPEVASGVSVVDFSSKKQPRKFYGISPEKWNLASKLSQKEYEQSEAAFTELDPLDGNMERKLEILSIAREFIQINFRKEDPSSHLRKLTSFWKMPHGVKLLSVWFEWLVGSSKEGNLGKSIMDHMDGVMILVKNYLEDKKGDGWSKRFEDVDKDCKENFGNTNLLNVFLIRELGKSWGNKSEKLIFIEGQDDLKNISNQPFVHCVKVHEPGKGDYEDSLLFSVRVGTTVVFEDVDLAQALAAVIHLSFVFNLMYPVEADDLFNFLQRVLASFGPVDGARSAKGHVKKNFVEFQCYLGSCMLKEKKANIQRMFV